MKILPGILAAFFALATVGVFILLVLVLFAWLGDGGVNFILPGLGLVVTAPTVLIALFIIGIIMLSITMALARTLFRKSPLS